MYTPELVDLLGTQPRTPEAEIQQHDLDLAKSIQVLIEEILISKARYLYERTQSENLSMAGGVALNCVANGKLIRQTPFERLYIQPAANDAGCALGAAALAYLECGGERKAIRPMQHVYFGPEYSGTEIRSMLGATSLDYTDYSDDRGGLLSETAKQLSEGKVLGWFQGRMEFGQRSLGARSIIADPRNGEMRDRINKMVKKREAFRPFAPSVLEDHASAHFDIDHSSPFMLETCAVISDLDLPAITHVDNSARIQTVSRDTSPAYYDLIEAFYRMTGCPIILNTSFNVRGQPIVNTPLDALICFINSGIDCLVLGDYLIEKEKNDMAFFEFVYSKYINFHESDIAKDVYTFL
jgi:carbamoyltransferase